MEPSSLPTKLPTFTSLDTHFAVLSIENVYQAFKERALRRARGTCHMDYKYIRNQANNFSTTIDLTLKSSQDGIILARDALTFFAAFGSHDDKAALMEYLEGLYKIANSGLDKAQQCNEQFLNNFELIGEVGLRPTKNSVYSSGKEFEVEESRLIELLSSGGTPWCLSLPFTVPSLIKRGTKQPRKAKLEGAKANNTTPNYACELLGVDLDNVRAYLSHLVAWWSETASKFYQMKDIIKDSGNSLCRDALVLGVYQQTWMSIKRQHSTYRDQVSMIQDRYPQFTSLKDVDVCQGVNKTRS